MVPLSSLWIPILLSAVIVFIASSIVHMVLPYHRNDFRQLPKEDDVMAALRKFNIEPGDYGMPKAGSPAAMRDPAFIERMTKGPVGFITVSPSGPPSMGAQLVQWFAFCLVVSFFSAYIAGHAVGTGATYLQVFRFVGSCAFLAYRLSQVPASIWYRRNWGTTIKGLMDGLLYGLLTAGTFGWLWPR